ncbi:MAG: hypothetical protein AVW06_00075 [Hadesarchaea archaeon DG-33-1]|nr:MAG: hypothetical protein AVW06_00075 [Hadesarchaea archaeon DG-33-1]
MGGRINRILLTKKFSFLAISAFMIFSLVSITSFQAAQVSASPDPATYYVKTPGFGSMSGNSWENAMGTIENAISQALVGDNIIVGDGTYAENLNINKENLTIRSENGADVTIIDAGGVNVGVMIVASGVTFGGFTVENDNHGIVLNSNNNALENNRVENSKRNGILLDHSNNNIIDNCIAENNNYGITLNSSDNNRISNNIMNIITHARTTATAST